MPRKFPKPFFRNGRGWYVQLGKDQIKLADGPENSDTQAEALKRYHEIMAERGRQLPGAGATPRLLAPLSSKSSTSTSAGARRTAPR